MRSILTQEDSTKFTQKLSDLNLYRSKHNRSKKKLNRAETSQNHPDNFEINKLK